MMRWKDFYWPTDVEGRRQLVRRALEEADVFRWILRHFSACRAGRKFANGKTLRDAWYECTDSSLMFWWLRSLRDHGLLEAIDITEKDEQRATAIVVALFPGRPRKQRMERNKIIAVLYRQRFGPTGQLR